jgi:transposase
MLSGLEGPSAIYLSARATDMRKSIDGLSGEVQDYLGRNAVDGSLFVFLNRRRDKIKMLWWERDGFWVFYKRLEAGTFQLPQAPEGEERQWVLSAAQLQLILSGVDLLSVRMRKRYRIAA